MNIITKIILTIRRRYLFFFKAFSFRIKGAEAGKKLKIFGKLSVLGPYSNFFRGMNCTINHYVSLNAAEKIIIGDNVIIGANSYISKSLESGYFYAGSPAIKIKEISHLKEN